MTDILMPPAPETPRAVGPFAVALLLFGSGACALIYQVAWLRMLRLVFGGTTAASAAVLAIFMGGLGFGALVLGRRADCTDRPLRLYATLELGVALARYSSCWCEWSTSPSVLRRGRTRQHG